MPELLVTFRGAVRCARAPGPLGVTLRPRVAFSGERLPARADVLQLHHRAHDECFIANSVTTEVRCEPRFDA